MIRESISKGFLLDSDRKLDKPVEIYKDFYQIVSENIYITGTILVCILIVFFIFFYFKKIKGKKPIEEEIVVIDPFEEAIKEISNLQNQTPAPQPKPFVFKLSEILRVYVQRAFNVPAMELTGEEFMREIATHTFFKNRFDHSIQEFVLQGDRVKYSNDNIDSKEMSVLLETALSFVKGSNEKLMEEKSESLKKND
jgi:hypothetical protein